MARRARISGRHLAKLGFRRVPIIDAFLSRITRSKDVRGFGIGRRKMGIARLRRRADESPVY